jgi:integrase
MKVVKARRRPHLIMRWVDPRTGERREQTTGTASRSRANGIAADRAKAIVEGTAHNDQDWSDFCIAYEAACLAGKSKAHRDGWQTTRRHLKQFCRPRTLGQFNAAYVRKWQQKLREAGLAEASVGAYSARLRAALRWAEDEELIGRAPRIRVPTSGARGGAISTEQFEEMLTVAPRIRPNDYAAWQHFMRGLWWSGFRLAEIAALSWDASEPIFLNPDEPGPVRFATGSHKGKAHSHRAIVPQFWELCLDGFREVPRRGLIFLIDNGRGRQASLKRISRTISRMGEVAGVVTKPRRTATAHDLRRSFITLHEPDMSVGDLKQYTGHQSTQVLFSHYHASDARRAMAKMWGNA